MSTVLAKLHDKDDAFLGELPDFASVQIQDSLNNENAWTMQYDLGGKNASLLIQDQDLTVKFFVDSQYVWEGLIEEDNWDEVSEVGPVTIAGRSPAGLLEFAKVYPKSGLGYDTAAEWSFTTSNPGEIFITLLDAAQARGAVPNITVSFTNTHDSAGNPWVNSNISIVYKAGVSLLDIIKNFGSADLADWRMNGKQIDMYNPGTVLGQQSGVIFRRARDIISSPRSRSRRSLGTAYLLQGDSDITTERTDPTAIAARGRKEQFLSQGGVTDLGTLNVIGDLKLGVFADNRISKTHNLLFSTDSDVYSAQPKPWIDYVPGQFVTTDLQGTELENYRLVAMTVSMGTGGYLASTVTLNDMFAERDILVDDAITILSGGSTGGGVSTGDPASSDKTVPNTPTGLVATSAVYFGGNEGIKHDAVAASWVAVADNTDGSPFTDFGRYDVQWWYTSDPSNSFTFSVSDAFANWSGLYPGLQLSWKVRAWDSNSHASGWSATDTITLEDDTTPPNQPSVPVVENYLGILRVTWDGLDYLGQEMPLDFKYTEVWYSTVDSFTPGDPDTFLADHLPGKGTSDISGLTYGVTYFAKLIAVDLLGNRSTPSDQDSATPQQVVQTDIGNNVIDFSNIRFKDIGNLIPDGSFELDTTAAIINAGTADYQVVANPDGATAVPSPNVLKVFQPGVSDSLVLCKDVTVTPGQNFATIYSYKQSGFSGTDFLHLQIKYTLVDGTSAFTTFFEWNSSTNTAGWVLRQSGVVAVPANAVKMQIQLFGTTTTAGATVYLDQLEVRQQVGTIYVEDAAITNAKIGLLAVNNANIANMNVGKLTAGTLSVDVTVSSRIKTANTGNRVELSSAGILAYDSSGNNTVQISATTGQITGMGTFSSGTWNSNQVKMSASGPWADPAVWFSQPSHGWGFSPTVYSSVSDGSLRLISAELVGNSSGRTQLWLYTDHFILTGPNINSSSNSSTIDSPSGLSITTSESGKNLVLQAGLSTSSSAMGLVDARGKLPSAFFNNALFHQYLMTTPSISTGARATVSVTWGPTFLVFPRYVISTARGSGNTVVAQITSRTQTAMSVEAYSIAGSGTADIHVLGWLY